MQKKKKRSSSVLQFELVVRHEYNCVKELEISMDLFDEMPKTWRWPTELLPPWTNWEWNARVKGEKGEAQEEMLLRFIYRFTSPIEGLCFVGL
jgi:hypothetical protein